jgi:hypothetical protein
MPAKKTSTKPATKKQPKPAAKKVSALDAAAQVLAESGGSMTTGELIEVMAQKKLWASPNGKTPSATLYAAILRELNTKGKDSRFQKTEPGKFAATGATGKASAGESHPAPTPKTTKPKTAKGSKKKPVEKKATAQPAAEAPPTNIATVAEPVSAA